MNRRSVLKLFPAATTKLRIDPPAQKSFRPLDEIVVHGVTQGTIAVSDAAGNVYLRTSSSDPFRCKAGGALGTHTVSLLDANGAPISFATFEVDCVTEIRDEHGEFQKFLADIVWTMMDWNSEAPVNVIRYKDRVYQFFANWVF